MGAVAGLRPGRRLASCRPRRPAHRGERVGGAVPASRLGGDGAARKIRAIDTNADGVLSSTEHQAAAVELFRDADQDSDGNLTTQEFEARYAEVLASLAA